MAALSRLVERSEDAENSEHGPVFIVTLLLIIFMAISILSSVVFVLTTPHARAFTPQWRARPGDRPYRAARTPRALEEGLPKIPEPAAGPSSRDKESWPIRPKLKTPEAQRKILSPKRVRSEEFEEIELNDTRPANMI
ncbi:hypothetical protein HDK90DRAFT_507048 [Phyllosticta capitalensis]|uniref:Uncharacterized protein n=1 Tax=Phyllosticta capitalensis TaxID=121624 RepID=A0ABR1Z4N2_9PEZI